MRRCWPKKPTSCSPGPAHRDAVDLVETTARLHRRVDKVVNRDGYAGGPSLARACSATCCRSSKHARVDQVRACEDPTTSVSSLGRIPRRQASTFAELQGRLPIRVELKALTREDLIGS